MMDFCGFFQGKSSEFAWIPEIPYTMHPLKKSPIKESPLFDVARFRWPLLWFTEPLQSKPCVRVTGACLSCKSLWRISCMDDGIAYMASSQLLGVNPESDLQSRLRRDCLSQCNWSTFREWQGGTKGGIWKPSENALIFNQPWPSNPSFLGENRKKKN